MRARTRQTTRPPRRQPALAADAPKAAIYTRLSQNRDGHPDAHDRQEADCRALAQREGLRVVRVYTDDDRSAYNGQRREEFTRMLADLDGYDAVIFWKLDRLVRRTVQFWKVVEACEAAHVRLVSVMDPIDTSNPIMKGVAGLVASMGEQESHNIGLRVKAQRDQAAKRGLFQGGRRPFGYRHERVTDKGVTRMRLVIDETEATLVREAVQRLCAGESLRSITADWNTRQITTTAGNPWRPSTLSRMLTGPHLVGRRVHRGDDYAKADWPPILTRAQRNRVVAILDRPTRARRGRPPSRLASSLLRCAQCGTTLHVGRGGTDRRRYRCPSQPGAPGCGAVSIDAGMLDDCLTEVVLQVSDTAALRKALRTHQRSGRRTATARLAKLQDQRDALMHEFVHDRLSPREWEIARTELTRRIDAERGEGGADTALSSAAALESFGQPGSLRAAWDGLSMDRKRAVVMALIDHITVAPARPGRNWFDPDRLDIHWRA
jgi:DNA invertase Pin-like site-specific DNA recombinase